MAPNEAKEKEVGGGLVTWVTRWVPFCCQSWLQRPSWWIMRLRWTAVRGDATRGDAGCGWDGIEVTVRSAQRKQVCGSCGWGAPGLERATDRAGGDAR